MPNFHKFDVVTCKTFVTYVSRHRGIKGNKRADALAKDAVESDERFDRALMSKDLLCKITRGLLQRRMNTKCKWEIKMCEMFDS